MDTHKSTSRRPALGQRSMLLRPPYPGAGYPKGGGPRGVGGGAASAVSASAGVQTTRASEAIACPQVGVHAKGIEKRLPILAKQHEGLALQAARLQEAPGQCDLAERADAAAHGHKAIGALHHATQARQHVGRLDSSLSHWLGARGSKIAQVMPITRPPASAAPRLTAPMLP